MAGAPKKQQAKTASKNNPSSRIAAAKKFFMIAGAKVEVKPCKFVGTFGGMGDYMAMERVDNGQIVADAAGVPYSWNSHFVD